jgi:hypothetical protein
MFNAYWGKMWEEAVNDDYGSHSVPAEVKHIMGVVQSLESLIIVKYFFSYT